MVLPTTTGDPSGVGLGLETFSFSGLAYVVLLGGMPLWLLASQGVALIQQNTSGTVFTFGSVLRVPFWFRRLGTAPFLSGN
jgi:hypothetical protein